MRQFFCWPLKKTKHHQSTPLCNNLGILTPFIECASHFWFEVFLGHSKSILILSSSPVRSPMNSLMQFRWNLAKPWVSNPPGERVKEIRGRSSVICLCIPVIYWETHCGKATKYINICQKKTQNENKPKLPPSNDPKTN